MLYDAERMTETVRQWVVDRCKDFGETETGLLYQDFQKWVYATRAMKRYPGPSAFGEALRLAGYSKIRKRGITFWVGIELRPK